MNQKLHNFLVRLVEITAIGAIALGFAIIYMAVKLAAWCEEYEKYSARKSIRERRAKRQPLRIAGGEFPRAPEEPLPIPPCRVAASKS